MRSVISAFPRNGKRLGALVFGHRAADLQQKLVVRVAAHGPVKERDLRPVLLQLLDQEHLVHVVAGQPVRRGDQDTVQPGARGGVAQTVEPGPLESGAAVAVVAEDALGRQRPALLLGMGTQPVELLVSRLRLGLALGRYSDVDAMLFTLRSGWRH
jgi:plasmid stability protein